MIIIIIQSLIWWINPHKFKEKELWYCFKFRVKKSFFFRKTRLKLKEEGDLGYNRGRFELLVFLR